MVSVPTLEGLSLTLASQWVLHVLIRHSRRRQKTTTARKLLNGREIKKSTIALNTVVKCDSVSEWVNHWVHVWAH